VLVIPETAGAELEVSPLIADAAGRGVDGPLEHMSARLRGRRKALAEAPAAEPRYKVVLRLKILISKGASVGQT
jgi:hypothetical protein